MKIVINTRYGGFGLSEEGVLRYLELKERVLCIEYAENRSRNYWSISKNSCIDEDDEDICWLKRDRDEALKKYLAEPFNEYEISRDDPALIQLVEEDAEFYGRGALKVVEIPDDVQYTIEKYDGVEWVAEVHRTWR